MRERILHGTGGIILQNSIFESMSISKSVKRNVTILRQSKGSSLKSGDFMETELKVAILRNLKSGDFK